jgi:DNA replication and repair protein RecF
MIVKSLELSQFRNYENLKLEFDHHTNILFGNNGQGKTNVLEAIYMSGTSRSHRGSKDKEMIRFGSEEGHIRLLVEKNGTDIQIDLHLRKSKSKGIAINKVPIRKAGELFGVLNVVVFSPEDLQIIKAGPSERRYFMNQILSQIDKVYLYELSKYHKILNQRNQLLKDIYFNPSLKDTLDIWDEQMISSGIKIIERRRKLTEDLNRIIFPIHQDITAGKEKISILYEENTSAEEYRRNIERYRERDLKDGTTHVGPHRDDLSFLVNDIEMRHYGSQGQQRTCALSLKLSSIELMKSSVNDTPVLLLDDVLSELDSQRQNLLLEHIKNLQTIITCTGFDEFVKNRFHLDKVFEVDDGRVIARS